ncbi:MAG: energy transducer TonB [Pseudomonadales bacterium]|nr:energy transducer TonB [Pseudomonadales bacterium]
MLLDMQNDSAGYWFRVRFAGFAVAAGIAFLTVCGLLVIEHYLIHDGRKAYEEGTDIKIVDFVRVKQAQEVQTRRRENRPPPEPDEMPPVIAKPDFNQAVTDAGNWSMKFDADIQPEIHSGGGFTISDGNYLPLVKVEPVYPRRALEIGLAGWVLVEFTVTRTGNILDPIVIDNCAVVQSGPEVPLCEDKPNKIFDRAALNAAMKFRYKPKVVNGEAIETAGVRNLITFELDS